MPVLMFIRSCFLQRREESKRGCRVHLHPDQRFVFFFSPGPKVGVNFFTRTKGLCLFVFHPDQRFHLFSLESLDPRFDSENSFILLLPSCLLLVWVRAGHWPHNFVLLDLHLYCDFLSSNLIFHCKHSLLFALD